MKNFTKEDFINKKVNLHLHTTFSDGEGNVNDILKQAKEKGYKKIAFCDHNTLEAYHKTDILKEDIVMTEIGRAHV